MFASPALVASEVMYRMPHAPLIDCSNGMITDSAKDLALAPGYDAETITTGGATSGNCEVGNVLMASNPIKRITNDKTMERTGLWMNLLNIFYFFIGHSIIAGILRVVLMR